MLVSMERSCQKEYLCEISKGLSLAVQNIISKLVQNITTVISKVKVSDRFTEWQTRQKQYAPHIFDLIELKRPPHLSYCNSIWFMSWGNRENISQYCITSAVIPKNSSFLKRTTSPKIDLLSSWKLKIFYCSCTW